MSDPRIRLTGIRIYPLKGAGGLDLAEGVVDEFGLQGDRRWMLVEPDGTFISQRTHPRLALIRAEARSPEDPSGGFRVQAPGMEPLILPTGDPGDPMMDLRLHRDHLRGRVLEGPEDWFSHALGSPCLLTFIPTDVVRPVDPLFAPGHRTGFSDGYPALLASEASLNDLNRHLPEPSSMRRFRPNLIVAGGNPWEEDRWRLLEFGRVELSLVKPCARCSVTTVDPDTGLRGEEPLRTMARVRGWEGKTWFGQNGVFLRTGSFRVGASVRILEEGAARPPISHRPEA